MSLLQPSRRGFLRGLIAAPVIIRASSLMPVRGWLEERSQVVSFGRGGAYEPSWLYDTPNGLLTMNMITKEAIRLFKQSNTFLEQIDAEYAEPEARIGDTLRIHLPSNFGDY